MKNCKGFTIIEALVSIVVLSIGITSCVGLASYVLKNSEISKDRLIAVNLAQEGIEVIRNIRDTNWLAEQAWHTDIIPNCDGTSYNRQVIYSDTSTAAYADTYLKLDSDGYYNYTTGVDTTFKRKLTVQCLEFPAASGTYNEMKIECTVYWTTRGTSKEILITEHLYDWK